MFYFFIWYLCSSHSLPRAGRGCGTEWYLRSLPTQNFPWFCFRTIQIQIFSEKSVWFSTSLYLCDKDELVLEKAGDIIPSFSIQGILFAQERVKSWSALIKQSWKLCLDFGFYTINITSSLVLPETIPATTNAIPFVWLLWNLPLSESLIILMDGTSPCFQKKWKYHFEILFFTLTRWELGHSLASGWDALCSTSSSTL